jgi:hypothetical protein
MYLIWTKRDCIAAVAALAIAASGSSAVAAGVEADLPIPASLFASATVDGCQNNPGPTITLSGELTLGGLNGRLIFRNNRRGTHERTEDVTVDLTLLPAGETIEFPKQPPLGGVGGNPWISIQFFDGAWYALSDPILLGRCVQGLSPALLDFDHFSHASVELTGSCNNRGGPEINLEGELALGGINAKLIFDNNRNKQVHHREEPVEVALVILPAGDTITFPKQPPLGGVGGNPLIFFQFTDGDGNALSPEISLGRCVQLSK